MSGDAGAQARKRPRFAPLAPFFARLAPLSPWGPPLDRAQFTKPRRRVAGVAGTLAATTALLAVLLLRFQGLGVFIPEVAVEWVVDHIPGEIEASAIGAMGGFAKVLALAIAIAAFLAVHSIFALYYPRIGALLNTRWKTDGLFVAAPALLTLFVVLPLLGEGLAGAGSTAGAAAATFSAVVGSAVFAVVLDLAYREFNRTHPAGIDLTRRTAIQGAMVILLAAAVGSALLGSSIVRGGRLAFSSIGAMLSAEVTPTAEFYTVGKNLMSPPVDPSTWTLTVDGLVDRPLTFTSNELIDRPLAEAHVTLVCVSNAVGGELISNGLWRGVPLAQLLGEAAPRPEATWALFTCEDGYTVGVPMLRANAAGSMLALYMNGERLPRDHGFPARVLVPGLYGMMHAKWLTKITLVDHEVEGFWQQKGWTNGAEIRATAIIAVAPRTTRALRRAEIGGVAFAGDRPIARVEVSDDGGTTWAEAAVRAPLSPYAWTLWTYDWTPAAQGNARLVARAYERTGTGETLQESRKEDPFPNGASGYDSVEVTVTA